MRCVKRNIADSCADGVRKKAKYLNDDDTIAPMPKPHMENHLPASLQQIMPQQHTNQHPNPYDRDPAMVGPMEDKHISPTMHLHSQQPPEIYGDDSTTSSRWLVSLGLDAFNSSFASGEFEIIGNIGAQLPASAAATGGMRTPDNVSISGFSPGPQSAYSQFPLNENVLDWSGRSNSTGAGIGGNPHTFAITAGPGSIATPSPEAGSPQAAQPQVMYNTLSTSPRNANGTPFFRPPPHQHPQHQHDQETRSKSLQQYPQSQHSSHIHPHPSHFQQQQQNHLRRRTRVIDPSQVYHTVTEPYSYVQAYHRLFAMVEARFTKEKQLRIARAFSAFRPSFIASIQSLKRDDLVFQEKCCQRSIHTFEASLPSIGTPTLVCRRSGEVVVVGKEFCMLSGWPKEILLGEKPNLNTNIPHAKDDEEMATRAQRIRQRFQTQLNNGIGRGNELKDYEDSSGLDRSAISLTHRPPGTTPVFLLELLDDESVCEFYEDFSNIAFADSTGKKTRRCKILKYKPPTPISASQHDIIDIGGDDTKDNSSKPRINGSDAKINCKRTNIDVLGSSTTIECMMCWTLRRDTFDIPMLIIMNVSEMQNITIDVFRLIISSSYLISLDLKELVPALAQALTLEKSRTVIGNNAEVVVVVDIQEGCLGTATTAP